MGAAGRLRTWLAALHKQTAWLYSGYSSTDLKLGLQVKLALHLGSLPARSRALCCHDINYCVVAGDVRVLALGGRAAASSAAAPSAAVSSAAPVRWSLTHHHPLTSQMLLGWAILTAILTPTVVWDKLGSYGISVTFALIVFSFYVQPASGANVYAFLAIVLLTCLAGVLGFIPTYLAIAANGGTWAGYAAAKGATLVAVCAVISGLCVVPLTLLSTVGGMLKLVSVLLAIRFFPSYWVSAKQIGTAKLDCSRWGGQRPLAEAQRPSPAPGAPKHHPPCADDDSRGPDGCAGATQQRVLPRAGGRLLSYGSGDPSDIAGAAHASGAPGGQAAALTAALTAGRSGAEGAQEHPAAFAMSKRPSRPTLPPAGQSLFLPCPAQPGQAWQRLHRSGGAGSPGSVQRSEGAGAGGPAGWPGSRAGGAVPHCRPG